MQKFLLKVFWGAAAVVFLAGTIQAETWPEDPTTGCKVWSVDDGSAKEVVIWSGSCEEGKATGSGVLVVYNKDGLAAVYKGEMSSGKANGTGSLKLRSVETGSFSHFQGFFVEGKPMGDGIYHSSEGWSFMGYFNGSLDSAEGIWKSDKGNITLRGEFVDGKLTGAAVASYTTENNEYYFGDVLENQRHGVGTLVHADNSAYIGDFQNGVASGVGAYEGADGSVVVGLFDKGEPNGAATYIAPNKDSYQGLFADGKLDGMVLVTRIDGTQSVENWKNGEKQE